ncbi:MAG: family 78 glycoside hydrolase catalytic domain [Bacteroidota bacterium]
MKMKAPGILIVTFLLLSCCQHQGSEMVAEEFSVEFISNIDHDPIFSWKLAGIEQDLYQAAYRIIISEEADFREDDPQNVWDSGLRKGSGSLQVRYEGQALVNGRQYYARVRYREQNGISSDWCEAVRFVVPLAYPEDWKAQWLTWEYSDEKPLPLFRKPFMVKDPGSIDYVMFYMAAPGYYEASLNGVKIGENVLDPGQTNYEDYTYYTAYEIDPADLSGENVLGVMLGNGWYNQNQVWKMGQNDSTMIYGQPLFTCQLVIHRKDETREVIGSDGSWLWTYGPVTYSNIYGGEHYDASLEIENWNRPGEVEGEWYTPLSAEEHPADLFEQFAEPIRIMEEREPLAITDQGDGSYVFDFGQNMAGWMELKIAGEPGQEITIQCAEELDKEGNLDFRSTGTLHTKVLQTQKYRCRGEGMEIWRPRFTYFGFRYAQVSGLNSAPDKAFLKAQVVHSSVPDAGSFQCSEEQINRLHELAHWTIRGNIHSIPTDCPQREKCGWTGDAHAMIQPMVYNFDAQRFFSKYMFDMRSSGREEKEQIYFGRSFQDRSIVLKPAGIPTMIAPGKRTSGCATADWGTAIVQIPWYLYLYYGDRIVLDEFYPDMKRWVEYVEGMKEEGIIPHGLGDWCPPGGNDNLDCPVPVSSTAFHLLDVSIMEKVAQLLGKSEDQELYKKLNDQLKTDFNRHFFDPETENYGNSQTANIMALDMHIVPNGMEKAVASAVIENIHEAYDGFLNTGIFGLARILNVLAENGFEDEVYRLLTKTGQHSFAFMWDRYDVTTLWEVLPINDENEEEDAMRSHSHPMQAGYDTWFYSGIAGINPVADGAGFQKIAFKPYLTRHLESASATYESKSGIIRSMWERSETGFTWNITIPANAEGAIYVPTYGSDAKLRVNGAAVEAISESSGFSLVGTYGPGEYLIETLAVQ